MDKINLTDINSNKTNNNGDAAVRGISGFGLKMIAIVTMLIDHIGAGILEKLPAFETSSGLRIIDDILRCVGRMAFPIFVFLIVEGFLHTRNKYKYAIRLFVFALISEIPFDLAFNGNVLEFDSNNVFITLFLGLFTITLLDYIANFKRFLDASKSAFTYFVVNLLRFIGMAAVILGFMLLASIVFSSDYGAAGVGAIVLMYLLRRHPRIGFAAMVILLAGMTNFVELFALFMLIPIGFYNGKRGTKVNKYVFYAFYPVHLLVIAGVARLMLG